MNLKKFNLLTLLAILTSCSVNSPKIEQKNDKNSNQNIDTTPKTIYYNQPSATPLPNSSSTVVFNPSASAIPTTNIPEKKFTLSAGEIKEIKESNLTKANNTFGVNFFKNFVQNKESKNTFMSSLSMSIAFQMLINGADGNTRDELAKVFELGTTSTTDLNKMNKLMIARLNQPSPETTINVANSLWFDKSRITVNKDFQDNLTNYYDAESKELDFSKKESAELINKWCSDKTNGKIPSVLDPNQPIEEIAYLINALYFKSSWKRKFEKNLSREYDFNLDNGTKKKVTFMNDFRDLRVFSNRVTYKDGKYIETSNKFIAVDLPYGKDEKVSMYIFLPDVTSSLSNFYKELTPENLDNWFKKFSYTQGYIALPKFKMNTDLNLVESLNNMGIKDSFDSNKADFKKMGVSNGNIYITKAFQKAFVDVNEEGTEAAAVTVIAGGTTSSSPSFSFTADRPFFFVIRDNETGLNLFMGAVNDPEYK